MSVYSKGTYQGKWTPTNPHKYKGDANNITFRSSWESKFMKWCDLNDSVVEWASEEVIIPYFDKASNKMRRYYVDFWIKIRQKDGSVKKFLIEIKPEAFTLPPKQPKRKTKRYVEEVMQWVTNQCKWEAAKKICEDNNMEFLILTEQHLGIKR